MTIMEFGDVILQPKIQNVTFIDKNDEGNRSSVLEGTLCITGHHLIMSSTREIWILHRNIDSIEKKTHNLTQGGVIILKCKDFRIFHLHLGSVDELNNTVQTLEKLSSLDQTMQYPFYYKPQLSNRQKMMIEDGWSAFIPVSEWSRLLSTHGDEWRITYLNRDYKVCNSYPSALIVPRQIEDSVVLASAAFRDGGRFPVLCYRHEGGSILLRSGQPMCGVTGRRCREDERLLNSVLSTERRGYIIDTRSITHAQTCKAKGGGTELDSAYPQWRKVHKSVPKTTDLLDSLSKLVEACNDVGCSSSSWLSRLDNSGWLSGVQSILDVACVAAQCLHHDNVAVLVHGGSGRDSTLIITSLTQIILNPDCRTIRGLQALIEREWLQAGHPFFSRTKKCAYSASALPTSSAPTFVLFLDCLYQLVYQFQFSFEYTSEILLQLFKHAYCSNYGTFLGDSEQNRYQIRLSEKTCSLWTYMNQPNVLQQWLNVLYEPNPGVIWPSVAPVSIQLWRELYLAHTTAATWQGYNKLAKEIKQNQTTARKVVGQLQAQLKTLIKNSTKSDKPTLQAFDDDVFSA